VPSLSTKENLNVICKQTQQLDNSIRFVGIANNLGSLDPLPHEAKDLNKQKAVSDIIAGVSFSTLR
jgi:hypothetical protein